MSVVEEKHLKATSRNVVFIHSNYDDGDTALKVLLECK